MRVRVRLFAGTRDAVGLSALDIDVPEGACVDDVVTRVCDAHPRLTPYRPHVLLALDGEFVTPAAAVRAGSELALMPPVSGGSLPSGPFSLDALHEELGRTGAGATVVFVGHVRGDGGTHRLRFEAYETMAERELEAVRREAIAKFALVDCIVRHRIATLAVGEPIVAVATAAAHRREAFEAAQWIMDEIKARVPIWKAEEATDGARWVNDPTSG